MSIDTRIGSMFTHTSNAYDKITEKGGTIPEHKNLQNLADAIDSISTGGGGTDGYLVEVIDFRGNVYYSQRHQTGDVVELPSASDMALEGMTFQEFSAPVQITNNTITVEDFDLTIGGIYTTASGKTEIDIELTTATGLNVTLNIDGNKDWGDGSAEDTATSHTYAQVGKYTIKCDGNQVDSGYNIMHGSGSFEAMNCVATEIRFNNTATITGFTLQSHCNLKYISISKDITYSGAKFYILYSLKNLILPSKKFPLVDLAFGVLYSLDKLVLNKDFSNVSGSQVSFSSIKAQKQFLFNYGYIQRPLLDTISFPTEKIIFLTNVASFYSSSGSYGAMRLTNVKVLDFTRNTSVPTMSYADSFKQTNYHCKIVVPDSLYTSWISATNWSAYADYIVKASEYVE